MQGWRWLIRIDRMRNIILVKTIVFLSILLTGIYTDSDVYGQEPKAVVAGSVVDAKGLPLVGATVTADNGKSWAITGNDGDFSMLVPSGTKYITVSYLGFKTKNVSISSSTLKVILEEDGNYLEELVVVGYSTQKKETLTGSIAVLDSKSVLKSSTANISNALVGRVPGIISNQASGEVGNDASTIRIRGIGTFNSTGLEPLVVIDGIESDAATMNALDPNEIMNISVLKDASSTAVYGVRGANGVILVTTKRGENGKVRINFTYRFGLTNMVSLLKPLGSYEYALYRNEAIAMDADSGKEAYLFSEIDLWKFRYNRDYTPDEVEMLNISEEDKYRLLTSPALYYGSHDYIKEQFGGVAPQQQYNINFSGGGNVMKYFVSLGYLNQEGAFQKAKYRGYDANSKYDRYNFRSNLDIAVSDNTDMAVDFGGQIYSKAGILGSSSDGDPTRNYARYKAMMVNILANTPFVGPGIVDGNLVNNYSSSPLKSKGGYGYSPLTSLMTAGRLESLTTDINVNLSLRHRMDYLTKGLTLSGTVSYKGMYRKGRVIWNNVPVYSVYRNPDNPMQYIFSGGVSSPKSIEDNKYNDKWRKLYIEGKISWERMFDSHNVTAMVIANASRIHDPSLAYNTPAGLVGMASRLTYAYKNKWLAEVNIGYNGSENFPKGHRFGFFPAFSLGWVLTNEDFMPENDILTWLKVRVSYGEVGNDKIGGRRFLYLNDSWGNLTGTKPGSGYYFGSTDGSSKDPYYPGAYENVIGNPDVTWEVARKSNAGIDANFLSDRLSLTADLFMEKRNNILWNLGTVPGIVAADLPPANIGRMTNKGYELSLRWSDDIGGVFNYSVTANVSYAENRIDYMDEPAYPYPWMNTTGFSYGQYKGYKTGGFYNSAAEASNRPYVSRDGNKVQAGDIRYIDIDGDGVIDANDQVPIGWSNLPRYSFSSNIDLEYKGIALSLLFTGSYKGSMPMTSFYIQNPFYMNNGAAMEFQYDGRWTEEKAAAGIMPTFPRASMRTYDSQNGAMNDLWVRSTQFIRLKNAELSYTVGLSDKIRRYGVSSLRIFLNGNNLCTWGSKLPDGFDPEQEDANGASMGYLYPPTRTFSMGVNLIF